MTAADRPTLPNVIRDCAENFPEREFIAESDARYTFAEIAKASAELALGLVASGIGKATRVGLLMGNGADWVTAWWAAARAGALTVPISTLYQAREVGALLAQTDIDTLLVQRRVVGIDYEELLEKALPGLAGQSAGRLRLASHPYLRRIVVWGEASRGWATPGPAALLDMARDMRLEHGFLQRIEDEVVPSDLLIAICTSGSTAEPKVVVHTHASVVRTTLSYRGHLRVAADDRCYSSKPLFWLGGLNVNLLQAMHEGACMVFPRSHRVDDVVEIAHRERVSRMVVTAAQQKVIIETARSRGLDLGCVTRGLFEPTDAAGAIIPEHLRSRGNMGMTETFGAHGCWPDGEAVPPERSGSAGQTRAGMERKIVDPETGRTLPHGEVGELYVRGYSLMDGYYKRERAEAFTPDGFFPTGDLCVLDEAGFVYFRARRGDMIKTSGANVAPAEVEAVLLAVGNLKEAIVFGMPDARKGERVVCVAVPVAGSQVSADELRSRMKGEIANFKIPAEFYTLPFEAVPRTASGKPIKGKLKDMIMSGELLPVAPAPSPLSARVGRG